MKILVTGANGYLGRGVVKKLLDTGAEVVATDFSVDNIDSRAIRIAGDVFNTENPYRFFGEPDALLHMAWRDGFVYYSDAHIIDLPKHYSFLNRCIESGIGWIAVIGSMHEIGFYEGSIKEDTPCNPTTPYGISKNALRGLVEMLTAKKGISYQWLRGYYIVGNTSYGNSIFSKIVSAEENGQEYFPFTMGQNQYDFVDYDVFCQQVAAAVSQTEINGIINICSGRPEKLADRVEAFIKENNFSIKLNYGAYPDRAYDSKAVWGDSKKINMIMDKNGDGER